MKKLMLVVLSVAIFLTIVVAATAQPKGKEAAAPAAKPLSKAQRYTEVAGPYRGFTYYSDLGAILTDLTNRSKGRIQMAHVGDSAGGHPIWNLTVTWPMSKKAWAINDQYRALLLTNPTAAKAMLSRHFNVPGMGRRVLGSKVIKPVAFINCSIHGGETTGVDAGLILIRRLALKSDAQTVRWLKNTIIVIDPVQNPDGRIAGTRGNANGFDCNRDFITLTQPEDVITAGTERRWLPNTMIDLHTQVTPTLIEPTTIPHNPNMEFDIQYSVEIPLGIAMGEAVHTQLGQDYQIPYFWGTAADRTNSTNEGWDDYGPYYTPQLAQEYGSAAFTNESAYTATYDGVLLHYTTSKTMVDWTSQRGSMLLKKQCDWAQRGFSGATTGRTAGPGQWNGNMTDMIRASVFDPITNGVNDVVVSYGQAGFPYINAVGQIQFPRAYVIPVDAAHQKNVLAAYKALNHALWYGIKIQKAKAAFVVGTTTYPAGTFIVPMKQTLRGLANNLFWDGEDVKAKYGVSSMYDISAWSLKYAYGITADAVTTAFTMPATATVPTLSPKTVIYNATDNSDGPLAADQVPYALHKPGSVPSGPLVYWWEGNNVWSVRVANECLKFGFSTGMVTRVIAAPFDTVPQGAFVVDVSASPWAMGLLNQYAATWGVDFHAANGLQMTQVSKLARPNVLINADANSQFVIQQTMGFQTTSIGSSPTSSNDFMYSTSTVNTANVSAWLGTSSATRVRTIMLTQGGNSQANASTYWGNKVSYTISAITAGATSTQITTTAPNALVTGDFVALSGTDSTPTINRTYKVTVVDASTFTIPYGTTANGTAGTVTVPYVAIANDRSSADNGFMATDYTQNDALTATYPAHGLSFSYPPYWYKLASGGAYTPTVDATFRAGTAGAFLQGFWNYPSPEAVDSPALIDVAGQNAPIATIASNTNANPTSITTSSAHFLTAGQSVTLTGTNSVPSLNGTYTVVAVPDTTHFTVSVPISQAPVTITAISATNPAVVTTATPHGFVTGQSVNISGSNSTPTINGDRVVTVIDATSFSVAVNVTVAGTAGSVRANIPVTSAGTVMTGTPTAGDVILAGFNPMYRGYQDNTAILVARAAFLSNCTPPSVP